jgi:hypothetical protein
MSDGVHARMPVDVLARLLSDLIGETVNQTLSFTSDDCSVPR